MKRILVIGELNVDLILSGLPSLPVLGRELLGNDFAMTLGSSSAITAARLAALGADDPDYAVDFAGLVGDDQNGRFVLEQLQCFGVQTKLIQTVDSATGVTIALTFAHDRALLTYPGAMSLFDGANITTDVLEQYQHVHVGSYYLQTALQPYLVRIFQTARQLGVTTSLDVGWDPSETWMSNPHLADVLKYTDNFLPNEEEAAALAVDAEALRRFVDGTLFVKRGGRGASAYFTGVDGGIKTLHTPAFPVTPIDTTGAGDAFNAGVIYAQHIRGEVLDDVLRFAAVCGAQATQYMGGATAAPTEQTIRDLIAGQE